MVADGWSTLPVRDAAMGTVLSVFAPRTVAEIGRVLEPGGRLVAVTPDPEHLAEIRDLLGMLAVDDGKADKLAGEFRLIDAEQLRFPLALSGADAVNLVRMGPAARHRTAEETAAARRRPAGADRGDRSGHGERAAPPTDLPARPRRVKRTTGWQADGMAAQTVSTLVILGASGDLAHRLLLPGLGGLLASGRCKNLTLVGSGMDDWTDQQWQERVRDSFSLGQGEGRRRRRGGGRGAVPQGRRHGGEGHEEAARRWPRARRRSSSRCRRRSPSCPAPRCWA